MSFYFRVCCTSAEPILAEEIRTFIAEGTFFDSPPRLEFSLKENSPLSDWDRVIITYQDGKRPVDVMRSINDGLVEAEKAEILDELKSATDQAAAAPILSIISDIQQIIALEVERESLTSDAWEMVDSLQSMLARRLSGVIYVPDEAVYDNKLQPILKLN